MDKETLLNILSGKIDTGEISRQEVLARLGGAAPSQASAPKSETSVTKVLYSVGAVIVLIGIVFLLAQIWDDLGSFGRIAVTLGLGVVFAAMGSVLMLSKPEEKIGAVFHTIGGAIMPIGVMVFLYETIGSSLDIWPTAWSFGVLFIVYLVLTLIHRHAILTFFTIGFGTAFIYLLTTALVDSGDFHYQEVDDIYAYLTMVLAASYLLLAHSFANTWNQSLTSVLRFFGSAGFLGAAFSRIFDSGIWELIYTPILIGGIYLATRLRSRGILFSSMIFLFAYIIYITSEYFADSLGWPISLVLLGFVLIGLGYVWVHIQKRYIKGGVITVQS